MLDGKTTGYLRNCSDEELLEMVKDGGDIEIAGILYTRYMSLVYGLCLKYLGNRQDAQDAVMAIFEKLISGLSNYEVRHFRPWLYVFARNHCLMILRSAGAARKKIRTPGTDPDRFMENGYDVHPIDREDHIDDEALDKCIERLKEQQKECVRLFYFMNRSYRDIAGIMNIDEKKVKSYLQNAKRNLKICLEADYEKER